MPKTIGTSVNNDEIEKIEKYCKDNNITKSEFIKNGIKNQMNQEPSSKSPVTLEPKKDIHDMSLSEINEELKNKNEAKIYSKDDIKNQIKPQIKKDTTEEVISHMKNKNCGSGCNICNTRDSIKNTALNLQEQEYTKAITKHKLKINQKNQTDYNNGLCAGINFMRENSDEEPKKVYEYSLTMFENINQNSANGLKTGIFMTKRYPDLSKQQIYQLIINNTITN